jgi:hypothetical protein
MVPTEGLGPGAGGIQMRARTAGWLAGDIAAGSIALMAAGLALAYVDRHRLSASLTNWNFSDVLAGLTDMSLPVLGFVLASRRPENRIGWLALAAGLMLGLSRFGSAYGVHGLVVAPGSLPGHHHHRAAPRHATQRSASTS